MKSPQYILSLLVIVLMLASSSCMTQKKNYNKADQDVNELEIKNNNTPLDVYLKRLPGVRVTNQGQETSVYVRGGSNASNMAESKALFVVDGNRIGNDYSALASVVDVNDIKSVRVLREATDTAEYGLQGSNGVIVIKTKQN
ncbi:MAG: TonB-dependent receptor plug domain-containing protein [Bacteroidota bacterium]